MTQRKSRGFGGAVYVTVIFSLATYFTFAAVQGDYGLFRRVQIDAEREALERQRDQLADAVAVLKNKTRRLSDDYLDLDLLDEQARDVLGLVRRDEVVLQ